MTHFPDKLQQKLELRKASNALRELGNISELTDFSSNDYLGFSRSETLFKRTHQYLLEKNLQLNGASGSRLLSGNHELYPEVENTICSFHNSETALIFNSGYDANLGIFASIPQRGDIILYDELIHASIRDGITMSHAKSYKFKHNDLEDLKHQILRQSEGNSDIYVVTESVFSMDGDCPDLQKLVALCEAHNAFLIIDEAHALGVFGENGTGLIQTLGLEHHVFARVITFGKALGCHGAAVLGSNSLKQFLINFARSFIYTTALPPHSLATIKTAYKALTATDAIGVLASNIRFFKEQIQQHQLSKLFIESRSAIHSCIISGNDIVKNAAIALNNKGFDVKPILSPTVAEGQERLRFCIHSYNSEKEIEDVLQLLATFVHQKLQ